MARIKFDSGGMVAQPNLILMTKSGERLGLLIGIEKVHYVRNMNSANEISFRMHKMVDGEINPLWEQTVDFKAVWYRDVNECFEISVETDESDETIKHVNGKALAESELSQVLLFNMEINTEADIAREDYTVPTVFYDEYNPEISLLDRILYKAPHYTIGDVSGSLNYIQRTFSFDNKSIPDALSEVAEEIGCVIIYGSGVDENGDIVRKISAYDLMNRCTTCYSRFEGSICPTCGSTSYYDGYGSNTGIVVAKDNLADDINYSSDTGAVKNCFRLAGGDDVMTAAIRSCNPNGSSYIWNITDDMKADMSDELVSKLDDYDELYEQYVTTEEFTVDSTAYNAVVDKYIIERPSLSRIYSGGTAITGNDIQLKGTSSLVEAEYAILDFSSWLQTSMMPVYQYIVPTAQQQCAAISSYITTVAVTNLNTASEQTVGLAIKSLAKLYAHTEVYKVEVSGSYSKPTWTGIVTLTNYSDETDTASTGTLTVTATSSATDYVTQLVQKKVDEYSETKYDITGLFGLDLTQFTNAMKEYSLDCLKSFNECCRACLSVLVDQGAGSSTSETYSIYKGYWDKLQAIESEMATREQELEVVGVFDKRNGLLQSIINIINRVHETLNFEAYVGPTLWNEFIIYRREQEYSNSNYCSNGLTNAELISNAMQFYDAAKIELFKSSNLQHSISASLSNLLVMKEFEGLTDNFDVGNWLYVIVDEKPYKLRLISFEIDFSSIQNIDVAFSDLVAIRNGVSDLKSVIDSAKSMATSYGAVARQAESGGSAGRTIAKIYEEGLDATKMAIMSNANNQDMQFNDSGLLGRRWVDEYGDYSPEQCMLINNGLAFTDDGWETVKTALGKIVVEGTPRYGLIADVIVGNLGQFATVEADKIVGGILTDAAHNNYWNLDTGEFSLSAVTLSPDTVIGDESGDGTPMSDVIVSVDVLYAKNQSTTTAPTTGWSTSTPTWESGYYIWQKTSTTNLYGDITYSEPTCIQGAKGDTGGVGATGKGVTAIVEQYYLSTSNTTQTGGSWSTDQPTWASGKYIWTRSHVTWTDSTTSDTTPVLAKAINGANSTANTANTTANAASTAVSTLDSSLNQQGIFNRLTNNGQTQGIYLSDGKVYINGTYIKTGTIDASVATITNLNASNITSGSMSAARITSGTMSAARISGGTLKLGGASNGNGLLEVYNASNSKIGYWDNTGINLVKTLAVYNGSISSSTLGGYVGFMNGADGNGLTDGISMSDKTKKNYFIATNQGWRATAYYSSTIRASAYGFINDDNNGSQISLITAGTGSNVSVYGNKLYVDGALEVKGNKNRVVKTDNYLNRLLYSYETASPMFGDVGEGIIDENGECLIDLDDIFSESINSDVEYQVFLQKEGPGDLWVSDKQHSYFVVSGTPDLKFAWEIKAKQKEYEFERLDETVIPQKEPDESGERTASEVYPENIDSEYYESLYDDEIIDFDALYADDLSA